jgi:glucose-6-phosphate dehydrogenase assembly protein OpcA
VEEAVSGAAPKGSSAGHDGALETWSHDFQVDPQQLENELRSAWQRARLVDDRTLYRGMTLNLIGVAPADRQSELEEALEGLLVRHPCRAFLVLLDETVTQPTMQVHVRVNEEASSRQLVLERILIRTDSNARGIIRSILIPSRLDDLPTLLFWHGDVRFGEVLGEFASIADHVAIDTATFGCADTPRQLLGRFADHVIDLAHFRLRPWRRALAEAFEKFSWQPRLGVEVEIRHRPLPSARCAATLLGRWLQERLQADYTLTTVDTETGPIAEPLGLSLRNGEAGVVEIEHACPDALLHVRVTSRGQEQLPFQTVASRGGRGDLLAAAADRCS